MKKDIWATTEIEKQRDAWSKEQVKPNMTYEGFFQLNDECLRLFPVTLEERQRKTERPKAIPEFKF
jgi:hypothetical protein